MECNVENLESHPAVIKTLVERCRLLSEQLKTAEDENCNYRIQLASGIQSQDRNNMHANRLLEQVERLKTQNQQFANQMNLVTAENKNLWSRLNIMIKTNGKLTKELVSVSETLKAYGTNSVLNTETGNSSADMVEELSMKLLNSLLMEKSELESQYADMVDLQNANDTVISSHSEQDPMFYVMKHVEKLTKLKQVVIHQQKQLKDAVNHARLSSVSDHGSVSNDRTGVSEQICPICRVEIPGNKEKFADHVDSHFDDPPVSFELVQ